MRRRAFITLVGGAAAAWPLASRAQQPLIGFLNTASAAPYGEFMRSFHAGLGEINFVEGRNVAIAYRWADGDTQRLPGLAAELVRAGVSVIVAIPASSALAAKAATTAIPIVFMSGPDPTRNGLVASLNRPGGNVTGVTTITSELAPKRLEVMRELRPNASAFAFLANPANPRSAPDIAEMRAAAALIGLRLVPLTFSTLPEIDAAFAGLAQQQVGAVIIGPDPFFNSVRPELASLATRHGMPAMFPEREYVKDGGLLSYGASLSDAFRQVGAYTGRVLKGENPAELPVQQPTKFELIVNSRTAKTLGITIPETFLVRADEVIE
jgi:putative ABC transport system substrate-binding protein